MDNKDKSWKGAEGEATGADFGAKLEQNIAEKNAEVAAGQQIEERLERQQPISEAEARALMMEETRKTQQKLDKASKSNRKVLVIAVVVALVLCAAGAVLAIMMGNRTDETDKKPSDTTGVVEKDEEEERPEEGEKPEEPEVRLETLALDDVTVQEIYGNFQHVGVPWDRQWEFYVDENVKVGNPTRYMMLTLAMENLAKRKCDGSYQYAQNDTVIDLTECYSGADMRAMAKEMFGKDLTLQNGDVAREICGGWTYDANHDEFHEVQVGCGGSWPAAIERALYLAETDGENIYLYEKALLHEELDIYHIGDVNQMKGELIKSNVMSDEIPDLLLERGDKFKWTFTKDAEGNYVFAGLERLE